MLNIVLASDNNYVPYLGVCLISIIKNNSEDFKKINVYILDDNIKESSKEHLNKLVKEYNVNLIFIATKNIKKLGNIPSIKRENNDSLTAYARLFISSLLPELDKVLYLDCDAIVINSLKELYNTSLKNYSCGAVLDPCNGIKLRKTGINMDANKNYFNSGVLLLNLKYWRENNIETKLIDYLIRNKDIIIYHDQDVINATLSDSIKVLHPKYNLTSGYHDTNYETIKYWENAYNYEDKIMEEAIENPVYLHFSGMNVLRPWFNKNLKYRQIYENYAKLTPFYEEIFKNDGQITKIEITKNNIFKSNSFKQLCKIIPQNILCKLAEKRTLKLFEERKN